MYNRNGRYSQRPPVPVPRSQRFFAKNGKRIRKLAKSYSVSFWRRKKYVRKKLSSRSCVSFTTLRMKKSYWPLSAAKPLLWEKRTKTSWEKSRPATGRNTWRSPSGTATRKNRKKKNRRKKKKSIRKRFLNWPKKVCKRNTSWPNVVIRFPVMMFWVTLMKTTALLFINANALLPPSWKAAMATVY